MENWQVAMLLLAGVFVGVTIPTIVQYQATLRSLNRLIRDNEHDIRRTVIEASQLSANLNRISATLDANSAHVTSLFEALEDVTEGVKRIRGTLKTASVVGAAVAPAVGAALRAMQGMTAAAAQAQAHAQEEEIEVEEPVHVPQRVRHAPITNGHASNGHVANGHNGHANGHNGHHEVPNGL